jgi:23S rRNA (cytosine1962-C5)-methyltransferase
MLTIKDWKDYELLDSGRGRKLERFGPVRLIRPEERAVWKPALPQSDWAEAHAEFSPAKSGGGAWKFNQDIERRWQIAYKDLRLWLEIVSSRQVGVFPENAVQWDWIREQIERAERPMKVLNLFGYTGMASIAASKAGAEVAHVDSLKRAVRLGKENQALNGLEDRPIRWIVEDAVRFVKREIKRGVRYDGVILDPPKYGVGPNKERWEFFEHFGGLCQDVRQILSETPQFVVVTAYALQSPPQVLEMDMGALVRRLGGKLEFGELGTQEKSAGRKISASIFGRWSAG